jgi:hypothetical protein
LTWVLNPFMEFWFIASWNFMNLECSICFFTSMKSNFIHPEFYSMVELSIWRIIKEIRGWIGWVRIFSRMLNHFPLKRAITIFEIWELLLCFWGFIIFFPSLCALLSFGVSYGLERWNSNMGLWRGFC